MLCSAENIVMKVHIVKRFLYLFDDRIYGFFPLALSQTYLLFQLFEFLRVKIFEGYVSNFTAEIPSLLASGAYISSVSLHFSSIFSGFIYSMVRML